MLKTRFSFVLFFMAIAFLLIQPQVNAQENVDIEYKDNAVLVTFDTTVDSAETVTSEWFSIPEYLSHSLYTYPVNYTKKQSSTLRVPVITVTVERSNDQTNVVITDTIGTVGDSLETLYSGSTNFNDGKSWYYRIKYTAGGTHPFDNATDAIIRTDLVFIRPK